MPGESPGDEQISAYNIQCSDPVQTVFLCIVGSVHMSFSKEPIDFYIFTTSIDIHSTTADLLHHNAFYNTLQTNTTVIGTNIVHFTKIDLRMFVIPFSVAASASERTGGAQAGL